MLPKLPAVLVAAAFVVLCACTQHHVAPVSAEYDATQLAGQAKGEMVVIGTLATFGSFEWGTAPLVTLAAASLKHVPQMLHDHELSTDEAQGMINAAVKVRALLKQANAACAQNDATGQCTGDAAKAQALAGQAKSTIASSCLSPSEKEILTCLHR